MNEQDHRQPLSVRLRDQVQDVPGCIKYILLALLILLFWAELVAGEFRKLGDWLTRLILAIKLLLIGLLVALIRVQRALTCQITAPTGCTAEEPDVGAGSLFVRVEGSASGIVFGSYTLELRRAGETALIPGVVSYPGGGGSGSAPVTAGELGRLNTTALSDGSYEITLHVHPAGPGAPTTCTITFTLLKAIVYINRVAGVPTISIPSGSPNPFDPMAELRISGEAKAVGGTGMVIEGAAYIYGCETRKIKTYEIRSVRVTAPGGEPSQPVIGAAIPGTWPVANRVPPLPLDYTLADQYLPWTRVGPAPINLLNSWTTMVIGTTTYYKLAPTSWNSTVLGSGRESLLLTAEDTTGVRFHDIQHIWLDNQTIQGEIVKFQRKNPETAGWEDLPPCEDLLLSFGTIRIMGLAWDAPIDEAWWPPVAPNDNYAVPGGGYQLTFWKQFSAVSSTLLSLTPTRVPALPALPPVVTPTAADAGELAQWDLTLLDADAVPATSVDPANKISRGDSCTYTLRLYITDTTIVQPGGTHYIYHDVPIKIVNDL